MQALDIARCVGFVVDARVLWKVFNVAPHIMRLDRGGCEICRSLNVSDGADAATVNYAPTPISILIVLNLLPEHVFRASILTMLFVPCLVLLLFRYISHIPLDPINKTATMQQTSAAILGLTSFGFVLGMRMSSNTELAQMQTRVIGMAMVCSIVVILVQGLILIGACCIGVSKWYYAIAITETMIALILMVVCFAKVVGITRDDTQQRNTVSGG